MAKRELTETEIREVAHRVPADPRTVRKVAKGEPVRGTIGERIRTAIGVVRGDGASMVKRGE
jgi:hypothetical protein